MRVKTGSGPGSPARLPRRRPWPASGSDKWGRSKTTRSVPVPVLTQVSYSVGGGGAAGFATRFFGFGLTAISALRFQKAGSPAIISFDT